MKNYNMLEMFSLDFICPSVYGVIGNLFFYSLKAILGLYLHIFRDEIGFGGN